MIKKPLINRQIRAASLRLIDENGKQLGVVSFDEAARLAIERHLDLIQVTEKVDPPVCRLGDFGKYLYQEEKKNRGAKKQKGGEVKGIRLTFNISDHDLETRANQAKKFLEKGDLVRIELRLRGREKALQGFGKEKITKLMDILGKITPIKVEKGIMKEPRGFSMIISKGTIQKNAQS